MLDCFECSFPFFFFFSRSSAFWQLRVMIVAYRDAPTSCSGCCTVCASAPDAIRPYSGRLCALARVLRKSWNVVRMRTRFALSIWLRRRLDDYRSFRETTFFRTRRTCCRTTSQALTASKYLVQITEVVRRGNYPSICAARSNRRHQPNFGFAGPF